MKLIYFTHSLESCWNHGNAHFLRGIAREFLRRGHTVEVWQPAAAWSMENLLREQGPEGLDAFRSAYPELHAEHYTSDMDLHAATHDADLVIVHEWNEPWAVAALGRARRNGARFTLLFHDTHHRAVSDPDAIRHFDLDGYDGVLAFGEALAAVYRQWGWGDHVHVWHEAADTSLFRPPTVEGARKDLVWIGNWGDEERSEELEHFLLAPARDAGLHLDVHGVRYPEAARHLLATHGAKYRGWLPNARAPEVFARHLATIHVPRRFYVDRLPGIPTIRVFEALTCGIPLICSPWRDAEGLFRPGEDFLIAQDGAAMVRHLRDIRNDTSLCASLAAKGLQTIRTRHTCAHRVSELLSIYSEHRGMPVPMEADS